MFGFKWKKEANDLSTLLLRQQQAMYDYTTSMNELAEELKELEHETLSRVNIERCSVSRANIERCSV